MPFWNCYYHVVWAIRYRQPMITPAIETVIFAAIEQKSAELRCPLLGLNAVTDHVHVAVNIAPSLAVSQWAGYVKGFSAHAVNASFTDLETTFKWQEGYGVVTFGEKNLPFVQAYIAQQKQHHAVGTVIAKLEQLDDE